MPDVPSAVAYGTAARGQSVYGSGGDQAVWAYAPWDTSTVTAAAADGAGTAPPAPVPGTSPAATIARGTVTWGTGTTSAAGDQVTVTFSPALPYAPVVNVTPTTAAAALLGLTVTATSTHGFTVGVASAPADAQPADTYGFSWYATL